MKEAFLQKSFWLGNNTPGHCKRGQFCNWLLACMCQTNDDPGTVANKKGAIENILLFWELPERIEFEKRLCRFLLQFPLQAPRRVRKQRPFIENGTDWERTYMKAAIESPGRFCTFINYNRCLALDVRTRSALLLLAEETGQELKSLENILREVSLCDEADNVQRRANDLLHFAEAEASIINESYSAWTARRLMSIPEGKKLAEDIERWIFQPDRDFLSQSVQSSEKNNQAAKLLDCMVERKLINDNDLFEIVAIVRSVQVLVKEMGFTIKKSDIQDAKPVVELVRGIDNITCVVQKGFLKEDHVDDILMDYRAVENNPTGFQPDIVYKFSKPGFAPMYVLGDAKNYKAGSYTPGLFAMLHYLIAFHEVLALPPELLAPSSEQYLSNFSDYKRAVLFFAKRGENKEKKPCYPQPGKPPGAHPILFVYGPDAETGKECSGLQNFFDEAIKKGLVPVVRREGMGMSTNSTAVPLSRGQ